VGKVLLTVIYVQYVMYWSTKEFRNSANNTANGTHSKGRCVLNNRVQYRHVRVTDFNYQLPVRRRGRRAIAWSEFDQSTLATDEPSAFGVERLHGLRRVGVQRNSAATTTTTSALDPAAIIAFRRCNVALAMNIADLFDDSDVYNARLDAAAAAAVL